METIGKRIRSRRDALRQNQGMLAKHVGVSIATISNWETGSHPVPEDKIKALADVLQVTDEYLLTGEGAPPEDVVVDPKSGRAKRAPREVKRAPIIGRVQAGKPRPVEQYADLDIGELPFVEVAPVDEYPNAQLIGFEVVGDSMNLTPFVPETIAVCVPWHQTFQDRPRNGQVVIVSRTIDDGQTAEITMKVAMDLGSYFEFQPRSTNPSHKPFSVPVSYFDAETGDGVNVDSEGKSISVVALVVGISIRGIQRY